jgi:hypothetical protein
MNATTYIMSKLDEVFAPMDAKVLEASKKWGVERFEAIKELRASGELNGLNSAEKYDRLYAVAGGKTWYNIFNGRNAKMIEEIMEKNCKMTAEKRNAKIASKLEKAGVTEVLSSDFSDTHDGFNGYFGVETNKGKKTVEVETIYAGGYNIQCLHLRVLVRVK